MEQLSIQSLGFLPGFQEDIKIPRSHGTVIRVSRRYQNHDNNKNHHRRHRHRHLRLPGRSLRVRANLRVVP